MNYLNTWLKQVYNQKLLYKIKIQYICGVILKETTIVKIEALQVSKNTNLHNSQWECNLYLVRNKIILCLVKYLIKSNF